MQTWRIIAAALDVLAGVVLVLTVMAKVRDRTHSSGQVAIGGAVTATVLLIVTILTLTVLPAAVAWGIVAAAWVAVGVMVLAS